MLESRHVHSAPDLRGAWSILRGAEPVDLLILDRRLPDGEGLGVCRKLKRDPRTRSTPIIVLTAMTRFEDELEAYRSGADLYLSKPAKPLVVGRYMDVMLDRLFAVPYLLAGRQGGFVTARELLQRVWGGKVRDKQVAVSTLPKTRFLPARRATAAVLEREHSVLMDEPALREVLDGMPVIACILDSTRQIVLANEVADALGNPARTLLGRRFGEVAAHGPVPRRQGLVHVAGRAGDRVSRMGALSRQG